MSTKTLALALAAGLVCGGAVLAQATGAIQLVAGDQTFANKVVSVGIEEVGLGQLASKSANPSIKQFGDQMVSDHSKANDQLSSILQQKGVTASHEMLPEQKAEYDRLAALSGAEFDREYKKAMIDGHTKVIADFKENLSTLNDSDLRQFAKDTLPKLQHHLSMAQDIDIKEK